jgi:hypothetical protein
MLRYCDRHGLGVAVDSGVAFEIRPDHNNQPCYVVGVQNRRGKDIGAISRLPADICPSHRVICLGRWQRSPNGDPITNSYRGLASVTHRCGSAPTEWFVACLTVRSEAVTEHRMYIGGGILGTILVIALIIFLLRRV